MTEGLSVFEQLSKGRTDKALGCVLELCDLGESRFRGVREQKPGWSGLCSLEREAVAGGEGGFFFFFF